MPHRRDYRYDDAYPEERRHNDAHVARCKTATLDRWLRRNAIAVAGTRFLEIGFGAGTTMGWLQSHGGIVAGQEVVPANLASAAALGVAPANLATDLAEFSGRTFDTLLYLDSFEHILEPRQHLAQATALAAPGAKALLVLPVADCLSRRMMGRFWPHDGPDHWVFYTSAGLEALWGESGWRPVGRFDPWKLVSAQALAVYWRIRTGLPAPPAAWLNFGVWLNLGERGYLFQRD